MHLDEDDLQDIRRKGAKVRGPNGATLKPLPEPPEAALKEIPESIRELAEALLTLAKREQDPITVSPRVTVEAPNVTVKPDIQVNSARSWTIEVTARDSEHRIKTLTIKAAD